jgi:hypothetical protein
MSSYFPGRGRKKPLNQIEVPIAPDIKKGPPRFIWTRKHWTVDTGRTQMEIEHIPQMMENNILYQSYDYNSQHAYGKYPSYDVFTNLEFRPPLIERDDILPLSRVPRPVVGIRINPGSAHPSGNSSFADSNMHITGIEKYISDRVKAGEVRPTFFAPIEMPEDNSILPDLETTLPPTSASAGFRFPTLGKVELPQVELGYKKFNPPVVADATPIPMDTPNAMMEMQLSYTRPQVSACAGVVSPVEHGLTPVDMDLQYTKPQISGHSGISTRIPTTLGGQASTQIDLDYTKPQISGHSGYSTSTVPGVTPIDLDLRYTRPQISAHAGQQGASKFAEGFTPVDLHLETKLEGSQPAVATPKMTPIYDGNAGYQESSMKIGESRPQYSYVVPSNTRYKTEDHSHQPHFRPKAASISAFNPQNPGIPQSSIPRAGVSTPQVRMKVRKDS